jgi:death-on-curing protein
VKEPRWINELTIILLHAEGLAEFGGREGMRDEGLLQSALARPQNLFAYKEAPGIAELAASYATGIARNHPFLDGNKRAAFLSIGLFLEKNGFELKADKVEATQMIFRLAAGELREDELADWIARHMEKLVLK